MVVENMEFLLVGMAPLYKVDKNYIVVIFVQAYKYTKKNWIVNFKRVSLMVWKSYLNKAA